MYFVKTNEPDLNPILGQSLNSGRVGLVLRVKNLGQVGSIWVKLGQDGSSWVKLGQVGSSCVKLGHFGLGSFGQFSKMDFRHSLGS